jgi:hypothetical protein
MRRASRCRRDVGTIPPREVRVARCRDALLRNDFDDGTASSSIAAANQPSASSERLGQTVFYSAAKLWVCLHAVAAVVLIGAVTHHLLIALGFLRGTYRTRLGRIYAATVAAAYAATMLLGAITYPTYRYYVRALYLDRYATWASALFELKEHFAALGLPFAVGAFVVSRVLEPREDRYLAVGYFVMVAIVAAIVWFDFFSGLLITMTKGV